MQLISSLVTAMINDQVTARASVLFGGHGAGDELGSKRSNARSSVTGRRPPRWHRAGEVRGRTVRVSPDVRRGTAVRHSPVPLSAPRAAQAHTAREKGPVDRIPRIPDPDNRKGTPPGNTPRHTPRPR